MPLDQVQTAVETFLAVQWTTTDIAYENDGYVPQNDTDGSVIPWVFVELLGGLYEEVSLGAGSGADNLWSDSGVLWVHIFVGQGTGSLLAKQYGATIAELFRGLELAPNIRFGDISLSSGGGSTNGNDWSLSLSVDWTQE